VFFDRIKHYIPILFEKLILSNVRDFFVFGGLSLLGYGLWLFIPWVSFSVSGLLLMLLGLGWLTRRPPGK